MPSQSPEAAVRHAANLRDHSNPLLPPPVKLFIFMRTCGVSGNQRKSAAQVRNLTSIDYHRTRHDMLANRDLM